MFVHTAATLQVKVKRSPVLKCLNPSALSSVNFVELLSRNSWTKFNTITATVPSAKVGIVPCDACEIFICQFSKSPLSLELFLMNTHCRLTILFPVISQCLNPNRISNQNEEKTVFWIFPTHTKYILYASQHLSIILVLDEMCQGEIHASYICGLFFFKKHFALCNSFTSYVFAIFDRRLAARSPGDNVSS